MDVPAERHLTAEVGKRSNWSWWCCSVMVRGAWSTIQWIRLLNWHIPPPTASPVCALAMTIPGAVAVRGAGPPGECQNENVSPGRMRMPLIFGAAQRGVDGLVVLQNRIDPAERAADRQVLPTDVRGKRRLRHSFGKRSAGKSVAQRAECTLFRPDAVRER